LLEGLRVCYANGWAAVPVDPCFGTAVVRWVARQSRAEAIWNGDGVTTFDGRDSSHRTHAVGLWEGLELDSSATAPSALFFDGAWCASKALSFARCFNVRFGLRVCSSLPPWQPAGYLVWLACGLVGANYRFHAQGVLDSRAVEEQCDALFLDHADLDALVEGEGHLADSIETLACSELPPDLASRFSGKYGLRLRGFWGPAEALGYAFACRDCTDPWSIGSPAEGVSFRLVSGCLELNGSGLAGDPLFHWPGTRTWDGWQKTGREATFDGGLVKLAW
jgi:hypothetical protein